MIYIYIYNQNLEGILHLVKPIFSIHQFKRCYFLIVANQGCRQIEYRSVPSWESWTQNKTS